MLSNFGWENDDNKSFTRRMLFLLEGTWLYGEKWFIDYRRELLEKYLREDSPKAGGLGPEEDGNTDGQENVSGLRAVFLTVITEPGSRSSTR
jgi:hypothetical protein